MSGDIHLHIGQRLRRLRRLRKLKQQDLGDVIGLGFRQIQKYESGVNHMLASVLYQLAEYLEVSISYFFEDWAPHEEETQGNPNAPEIKLYDQQRALLMLQFNKLSLDDRIHLLEYLLWMLTSEADAEEVHLVVEEAA